MGRPTTYSCNLKLLAGLSGVLGGLVAPQASYGQVTQVDSAQLDWVAAEVRQVHEAAHPVMDEQYAASAALHDLWEEHPQGRQVITIGIDHGYEVHDVLMLMRASAAMLEGAVAYMGTMEGAALIQEGGFSPYRIGEDMLLYSTVGYFNAAQGITRLSDNLLRREARRIYTPLAVHRAADRLIEATQASVEIFHRWCSLAWKVKRLPSSRWLEPFSEYCKGQWKSSLERAQGDVAGSANSNLPEP